MLVPDPARNALTALALLGAFATVAACSSSSAVTKSAESDAGSDANVADAPNTDAPSSASDAGDGAVRPKGVWAPLAAMPSKRTGGPAATGADQRIYVLGGYEDPDHMGAVIAGTVVACAPNSNEWKSVASMPTARARLAATTGPDGRIYAIGGGTAYSGSSLPSVSSVVAYAPSTNTWSAIRA